MERDEYIRMDALEARMWWYRGLHAQLGVLLQRAGFGGSAGILDAGCGTGGFLARLRLDYPACPRFGLDFEPLAAALAREKSKAAVTVGSVNDVPFAEASVQAVISADVLCHRSVDPARALAGFHRVLTPGGVLLLNLPAYDWMMGPHDRAVHTARRFTRSGLRQLLVQAGFEPLEIRYWNSFLFPLMVLRRKLAGHNQVRSDVIPFPAPVEKLFRGVMAVEARLLRWGISLPFGGSVVALARKKDL